MWKKLTQDQCTCCLAHNSMSVFKILSFWANDGPGFTILPIKFRAAR